MEGGGGGVGGREREGGAEYLSVPLYSAAVAGQALARADL